MTIPYNKRDEIRNEIKASYFLFTCVLELMGIEYEKGKQAICPYCGHRAFTIHGKQTQYFKCFHAGCEKTGDVIRLYQDFWHVDHNTALEELSKLARVDTSTPISGNTQVKKKETGNFSQQGIPSPEWRDVFTREVRYWNQQLFSSDHPKYKYARDYLFNRRKLSPAVCQRHGIGFNGNPRIFTVDGKEIKAQTGWIIPNTVDGELRAVRVRAIPLQDLTPRPTSHQWAYPSMWSDPQKYVMITESKTALYNASRITAGCKVAIVEGEFDVLSIESVTDDVIPVTMCSASYNPRPWDIEKLRKAGTIRIIGDNDGAGKNGAFKWFDALREHPNIELCQYPSGYKDANEILQSGPELLRNCLMEWFITY